MMDVGVLIALTFFGLTTLAFVYVVKKKGWPKDTEHHSESDPHHTKHVHNHG